MKDKYGDLLGDDIQLPLPIRYKHLLNVFEALDRNINLLKNRN